MALIAKRPILYGKMYNTGEELPGTDPKMVEAWLRSGSAVNTAETPKEVHADTLDIVEGHMTRESLETMTKANLEKLARDMGVEVQKSATKETLIDQIAEVDVEAPAIDGGAH